MALEEVGAKLTLKDRRQFSAEAAVAKRDLREVGEEAEKAGKKASLASAPSGGFGLLRKTLGFVSTAAKAGVTALGAAAGAAVGFGIKTRASMEQAQIGFTTMLGSAGAADSFLSRLRKFARETPFQLPDVVTGAQRLLAMGFAAKEVVPTLTSLGDAAAGLGLGAEGLDRITTAIGQIRAKGALQAEEMRQLAEAGIPAWDFLAKKLGVDIPRAMAAVEKRQVSSSVAITAITEGMNAKFGGLMEKQSHSIAGIWSNIKDTVSQGLGDMILPFQDDLKHAETSLLDFANRVFAKIPSIAASIREQVPMAWAALTSGDASGVANAVDNVFGGSGKLVPTLTKAVQLGMDFWTLLREGIIPSFGALSKAIPLGALNLTSDVMGVLADHATIAGPAIVGIAFAYYTLRTAMLATNAVIKAITIAQWAWNVAALANPYVLLAVGLAVLGFEIYLAYKKFDGFRRLVDNTARWVKDHWKEAMVVGLSGPVGVAVDVIYRNWDRITEGARVMVSKVKQYLTAIPRALGEAVRFGFDLVTRPILWVLDKVLAVYHWLADKVTGLLDQINGAIATVQNVQSFASGGGDSKGVLGTSLSVAPGGGWLSDRLHDWGVPGFAAGGMVMARPGGQLAVLGEGGRNEVVVPITRHGEVNPIAAQLRDTFGGGGRQIDTIVVPVHLDGRQITEVVLHGIQDKVARR